MDFKTILEQESYSQEVSLLGNPFTITAQRNVYNAIRNKYKKLALEAKEKFQSLDEQLENIEELLESAPDAFVISIEDALTQVIEDIISVDIYSLDKDKLLSLLFPEYTFRPFRMPIQNLVKDTKILSAI